MLFFPFFEHCTASVATAGIKYRDEMNEKVLWDVMWEFDTRIG